MRASFGVAQSGKRHRSREAKQRGIERAVVVRGDNRETLVGVRQTSLRATSDIGNQRFVDFFTKPVRDQTLLDAVSAAIERDAARRAKARILKRTLELLETLTPR